MKLSKSLDAQVKKAVGLTLADLLEDSENMQKDLSIFEKTHAKERRRRFYIWRSIFSAFYFW